MGFSPFVCLCNCVVHGKNNLRFAIFPRGIAKVAAKLGPLAMVGLRQQHRQVIMKSRGLGLTATRRAANSPMTHGIEHLQGTALMYISSAPRLIAFIKGNDSDEAKCNISFRKMEVVHWLIHHLGCLCEIRGSEVRDAEERLDKFSSLRTVRGWKHGCCSAKLRHHPRRRKARWDDVSKAVNGLPSLIHIGALRARSRFELKLSAEEIVRKTGSVVL
ncbi:hypothetical protein DFH94DRAFT_686128 [Russula ochroleuca]|uniref:Uncharacterized protein n=1 Tax=Russula ochroleuca TaxID=152965 RepID=A0A9P5JVZ0_9AGAM|nr:hypothetical protein DFH94DRAFT_686128 [Russula ochroleuca]